MAMRYIAVDCGKADTKVCMAMDDGSILKKLVPTTMEEASGMEELQRETESGIKEVVFEGERTVEPAETGMEAAVYYVYNQKGVDEIYFSPATAVALAYETSGRVVDQTGETIWYKGNRVTKNQIMAITEPEKTSKEDSLAVCLDTILKFNGITVQSQAMLEEGLDAVEILKSHLPNDDVVDLTGCPMDAMLYFTNRDVPVLAVLTDGEAVLITGFNEYNTVIFEPSTGKLYKKEMNDSAEWFAENGNRFIAYFEKE